LNNTGADVSDYQLNLTFLVSLPPEAVKKVPAEVRGALRVPIPLELYGEARPPALLRVEEMPLFDVVEVSERVTVDAGKEVTVGPPITVPAGEKVVLFEISCERSVTAGDPRLKVIRDGEDLGLTLDCYAMPDLDYAMPSWINARETLEVKLASTAGVTNYRVRYRYFTATITPEEERFWRWMGWLG